MADIVNEEVTTVIASKDNKSDVVNEEVTTAIALEGDVSDTIETDIDVSDDNNVVESPVARVSCPYCGEDHVYKNTFKEIRISRVDGKFELSSIHVCPNSNNAVFAVGHDNVSTLCGNIMVDMDPDICPGQKLGLVSDYPDYVLGLRPYMPMFVKMYVQANELLHIDMYDAAANMFRKALECIVKELLCFGKDDAEKSKVMKSQLFQLSDNYTSDLFEKQLMDAIRTLGNDATHFNNNSETSRADVVDMKQFLDLLAMRAYHPFKYSDIYKRAKKIAARNA